MPSKIIASLTQDRRFTMKTCVKSLEASIYALQTMLDGSKTLGISQDKVSHALSLLRQTREELQNSIFDSKISPREERMLQEGIDAVKQGKVVSGPPELLSQRDMQAMNRPSRGHDVPGTAGWTVHPVQGKIT